MGDAADLRQRMAELDRLPARERGRDHTAYKKAFRELTRLSTTGGRPRKPEWQQLIYALVEEARIACSRLRSSRAGEGAFVRVAQQIGISEHAVESAYKQHHKRLR